MPVVMYSAVVSSSKIMELLGAVNLCRVLSEWRLLQQRVGESCHKHLVTKCHTKDPQLCTFRISHYPAACRLHSNARLHRHPL